MDKHQNLPEADGFIAGKCPWDGEAGGKIPSRLFRACRRGKSAAVVFTLFAVCALAACQPTPEESVVVNKNKGVLESAFTATPEAFDRSDVPNTWTLEPFDANAKLTVSADARVEVPDTDAYPVYEIVKGRFTQEQADKVIDYFFGDAALYEANLPLTKAELQERLVQAKRVYQECLEGTNDASPEDMQEFIAALEAQIKAAPEANVVQVSDGQLKIKQADAYRYEMLDVTPDLSRRDTRFLSVQNDTESATGSSLILANGNRYGWAEDIGDASKAPGIETSPEQAIQAVQDTLNSLGFDFMEAAWAEVGETVDETAPDGVSYGYYVTCLRRAGGFLVTTMCEGENDESDDGLTDEEAQTVYSQPWYTEQLQVHVDDTGVTAIEWNDYGEIASTMSQNVALLPFADLDTLFTNAISAKYAWEDASDEERSEICITRVVLSMARIPMKDVPGGWQLVPAWEFYGTFTSYDEDGTAQVFPNTEYSLLTINAVDGSLIRP